MKQRQRIQQAKMVVSSIPNYNSQSQAYIYMLDQLKSNSKFKNILGKAVIMYCDNSRISQINSYLTKQVSTILNRNVLLGAVQEVQQYNKKRGRTPLLITAANVMDPQVRKVFSSILSLGIIFDIQHNIHLTAKLSGQSQAIECANEYSINNGKMKFKAMFGQRRIMQIPHTGYDTKHSTQKKFQNVLIDYRFELMFRSDKQKYKKFYNAYAYGDGVYAPFQGKYILITQNNLKQVSKVDQELLLPKDWLKFARVVEDD